jgi:hypothetical protein
VRVGIVVSKTVDQLSPVPGTCAMQQRRTGRRCGQCVGATDGDDVGDDVGNAVGAADGDDEGDAVGALKWPAVAKH